MPSAPKVFRPPGYRPAVKRANDIGSRARPGGEWLHSRRWREARALFLAENPL